MICSWFTSGIFVQVFRDYFFFLIEYLLLTYPIQVYLILVSTNHSNKKSIQFCNIPRADSIMRVACIHVYVIYTHIRRKPRWKIFWMEDFFFFESVRECTMLVSIVEIPFALKHFATNRKAWSARHRLVTTASLLFPIPRNMGRAYNV